MNESKEANRIDSRQENVQFLCNVLISYNERLKLIDDINVRNTVFLHDILSIFDLGKATAQTFSSRYDKDTRQLVEKAIIAMQERLHELVRNRQNGLPRPN